MRLISGLIAIAMAISVIPYSAILVGATEAAESLLPTCICDSPCTEGSTNEACSVCSKTRLLCLGSYRAADMAPSTQETLAQTPPDVTPEDILGMDISQSRKPVLAEAEMSEALREKLEIAKEIAAQDSGAEAGQQDVPPMASSGVSLYGENGEEPAGTITVVPTNGQASNYYYVNLAIEALNTAGGGTIYIDGTVQFAERFRTPCSITTPITILPAEGKTGRITRLVGLTVKGNDASLQLGKDELQDRSLTVECECVNNYITERNYGITVQNGAELLLEDGVRITQEEGRVEAETLNEHSSPILAQNGSVTMNGGEISENHWVFTGGAMTLREGSVFTMNGGIICDNSVQDVGGAIYGTHQDYSEGDELVDGARVIINDGKIVENTADTYGGAICLYMYTAFEMRGGEISDNRVEGDSSTARGGAIYFAGRTMTITGGKICNNSASSTYSNAASEGGAIAFGLEPLYNPQLITPVTVTFENVEFSNNTADDGGAIYFQANARTLTDGTYKSFTLNIQDGVIFKGNKATGKGNLIDTGYGGAIDLVYATLYITGNVLFEDNTSKLQGGGIHCGNCTVTIDGASDGDGVQFINNTSRAYGGGMAFLAWAHITVGGSSGSISNIPGGDIRISGNVTVRDNKALLGGGIFHDDQPVSISGDTKIFENTAAAGGGICLGSLLTLEEPERATLTLADNTRIYHNQSVPVDELSLPEGPSMGLYEDCMGGGGVAIIAGKMIMNGGTIEENHSKGDGGGVYLFRAKLIMYDVKNETSSLSSYCVPEFEITAGTIQKNTADSCGGGIYIAQNYYLGLPGTETVENKYYRFEYSGLEPGEVGTLSGGQVIHNTAGEAGGGIYLARDARLVVSGAPVVDGNESSGGREDNVFLLYSQEIYDQYQEFRASFEADCAAIFMSILKTQIEDTYNAMQDGDPDAAVELKEFGITTEDTLDTAAEKCAAFLYTSFKNQLEEHVQAWIDGTIDEDTENAILTIIETLHLTVDEVKENPEVFYQAYFDYIIVDSYVQGAGSEVAEELAETSAEGRNKYYYLAIFNQDFVRACYETSNTAFLATHYAYLSLGGSMDEGANIGIYSEVPVVGRVVGIGYPETEAAYQVALSDLTAFSDDHAIYQIDRDDADLLKDGNTNQVILNSKSSGDEEDDSSLPPIIVPDTSDDAIPNWLNLDDHYAYIVGYNDGTVKPENNITRAEVATIFFRLLTDEAREYFWSTDSGFSDVKSSDWFNNAVATMVNAGILTGYNDGTFRPNDPISRAEFATIAARFLSDPYSLQDQFYDTEGHWAEVYINRAAEVGWINGYNDGSFRPDKAITRAEAVTLVNNVLGREPHADYMLDNMTTWPDNPKSAWYYEDIQEATNSHDYVWASSGAYEIWTALLENRQWAKLEKEWSNAYSAPGGEVMQ